MEQAPHDPLAAMLAGLEWETSGSHRASLDDGDVVHLAADVGALVSVVSGSVRLHLGACRELFTAGSLVLLAPGHGAALTADGPAEAVVGDVSPVGDASAAARLPALVALACFSAEEPALAGLAASLAPADGCHRNGPADRLICSRIVTTVLTAAVRRWAEGKAPSDWIVRAGDPALDRVLEAVQHDLARAWTVEDLAAVGMLSRSAFSARFRAAMGTSPAQYVTHARIRAAMSMLRRDGLSVEETARRLGYGSGDAFGRAFRRHTGAAPAAWRDAPAQAVTAAATGRG